MPLLIDAYNLLHALQASPAGSERIGRAMLCRMLGEWSQRRGERVTVVFDGATPERGLAGQIADPRVSVLYSSPRNADGVIADLVRESSAPRRLTIVSSDREVRDSAARREAATIRSEDFARDLLRELRRPAPDAAGPHDEPAEKSGGADAADCDDWLRAFGYDPQGERPFEHP